MDFHRSHTYILHLRFYLENLRSGCNITYYCATLLHNHKQCTDYRLVIPTELLAEFMYKLSRYQELTLQLLINSGRLMCRKRKILKLFAHDVRPE